MPLKSFLSCLSTAVAVGVLGIIIAKSSVSTPLTPPVAFHIGAHWRLFLRRQSQQRGIFFGGETSGSSSTSLSSNNGFNIIDKISQILGVDKTFNQKFPLLTETISTDPKRSQGRVIRTAARPHQSSGGSTPSSRHYTTRKPSLPMIAVSHAGVTGDYNHYRTVALKSTVNRAISILTSDVSSYIQTLDGGLFKKAGKEYRDGDLGENVLVEGVEFGFFRVGQRYRFSSQKQEEGPGGAIEDVIVEITEPIEPCANLCKLPYINDSSISSPTERVARCQYFIEALGQKEGLRGWYARVIQDGVINVGDALSGLSVAV